MAMATHKFYLVSLCLTWLLCIASAEVVSTQACDENPGTLHRIRSYYEQFISSVKTKQKTIIEQIKLMLIIMLSTVIIIISEFQFIAHHSPIHNSMVHHFSVSSSFQECKWKCLVQSSSLSLSAMISQSTKLIKCITNHLCENDLLT